MLNQVYRGRMDRIARYSVYDWMDQDSDVQRALDLIAEHCVPNDPQTDWPFKIEFKTDQATEELATVLNNQLNHWLQINNFDVRIQRHVRAALKYGDFFYWRNPVTYELYGIHPRLVQSAIVDTNMQVLAWEVRGFRFNTEDMEFINKNPQYQSYQQNFSQGAMALDTKIMPAEHVIHLTLSEGKLAGAAADDEPNNPFFSRWPFGESILEAMYKTFKQRELLEDAFIIHRVQRAPTRRVWYMDVGKTRPDRAKWIIQDFRQEMNQRLIPKTMGENGVKTVDAVYNPQSQLEDYYIPVSSESRGSKVENLEGQPWNDIPELKYMTTKMLRALRVPFSMLLGSGSGAEESGSIFSDAKTGTAYMPEIQFSKYCSRLQKQFYRNYDKEFKQYLRYIDQPVTSAEFELQFCPPTNYEDYLQNMRDQDNIAVWAQIKDEPWISRRFAAIKYLRWSDKDFTENERMFIEENYPLEGIPDPGAGGGMGGMGGLPPMGGMPPLPGTDPSMDPTMAGGLGGSAAPMGGPGAGGGMAAPAGAGGGGMTALTSSREYPMKSDLLFEDDISLSDIKPAKPKLMDTGVYTDRPANNRTFLANDPINGQMMITLGMLRNLRRIHNKRRFEYQKRLKVIAKIYKKTPSGDGMMGMPPI